MNNSNEPIIPNNKINKGNGIGVSLILIILIVGALILNHNYLKGNKDVQSPVTNKKETETESEVKHSPYRILNNSLGDFDLRFLQLENNKKNMVYSPLSIKYALGMLKEGASGDTKEQIENIIGNYKAKKNYNTKNMSFANALFIKDTYTNVIKNTYKSTILDKYNAEIIYDSFTTSNRLNAWVSNKTFRLINNLFNDISNNDFILINALAINMEWINKIQKEYETFHINYPHRDFDLYIFALSNDDYGGSGYHDLDFYNNKTVLSAEIGAVINKYDIVKTLGADNIRKEVTKAYNEWALEECEYGCDEPIEDVNIYIEKYMKEIDEGYKDISSSTDFEFYTDDTVKVFAKDLKEYSGTTLQYIGIMPKNVGLDTYIKNLKSAKVNNLIDNLKSLKLDNFEEGYITKIVGYIPMFKMNYELKLVEDLNKLGITSVFTKDADLSALATTGNPYISNATHKASIEFANDGIKAAAAIEVAGAGADSDGFEYLYDVPVKTIDLTFDKPFMYIIRDKKTGEVWFTGTVYEPADYSECKKLMIYDY